MTIATSAPLAVNVPINNPALPRVSVTINDQEYILVYDFNAIARAEELTGMNLFSTFDFSRLSVTKFRAMLFATLLHAQPNITLEQTGNLVSLATLPTLTVKMVEAWNGSRPEVEASEPDEVGDEGNVSAEEASQS